MGTQAQVPQIQVTKDYGMFKLMDGNRTIDYNHVKRLKREMQAYPHMFASKPIEVNENMFIIDGQHRRQAAQELNVPVYYIIADGATLEETRISNVTQRRWSLLDFATSYANSGREDYKTFLATVKQHPNIAPSILRIYLSGGQKSAMTSDFRRGEFKIADMRTAEKNIEKLALVINKTHVPMNTPMAGSLLSLFNDPETFDFELFMRKLDDDSARELFRTSNIVRNCFRSIEDVYNYRAHIPKRLY